MKRYIQLALVMFVAGAITSCASKKIPETPRGKVVGKKSAHPRKIEAEKNKGV